MIPLEIMDQRKFSRRSTKFIQYNVDIPIPAQERWDIVFGIDPGDKNMGLTIMPTHSVAFTKCFEIIFPSERMTISRVTQIRLALCDLVLQELWGGFDILVSLEGSAYSMPYRNTELAEARIVAAEWFMDNYNLTADNFIFLTPQVIRKTVFGNSKIKAETQWPQLKGDAASSLAIALAGLALRQDSPQS